MSKRANSNSSTAPGQRRLRARTKLLFSLVTVLLVLALLEGAARLFVHLEPNARWEYKCRYAEGLGCPALNDILMADEQLFWRLRPNLDAYVVSGQLGDGLPIRFSVSTDAKGLRRVPATDTPESPIVFLGDSTTFGLGVEDGQTFPALLQKRMPGARCINVGVPGYSAYQGRVWLEHMPLGQPPDVVVICFGFNDELVWDHLSDVEHARLIAAERARFINHFRFVDLLRHLLPQRQPEATTEDRPRRPRLTDAEYAEQLQAMIRWCRTHGSKPILMFWPQLFQTRDGRLFLKQALMKRVGRSEDVPVVDLVSAFRDHGARGLFLDVVHASPAGCQLVADTLEPVLREALAAPRNPTTGP